MKERLEKLKFEIHVALTKTYANLGKPREEWPDKFWEIRNLYTGVSLCKYNYLSGTR